MNICLIMDNPETPRHPVIGVALHKLSATHTVRLLDVHTLTSTQAIAQEEMHLMTERGPIIVDVNAFPGFRGVRGAASALVALVEQLGSERQVAR